jgi:hypothetical protein
MGRFGIIFASTSVMSTFTQSNEHSDTEEFDASPTIEYVKGLLRNLDPAIIEMDPDDAPTVQM